jgi:predicted DNA-binding transcriptional regulator YafY
MVYDNRIKRLIFILKELNIGNSLSIVSLSHKLYVSEKIIRNDFKHYLLPLFEDKKIYKSSRTSYKAKIGFLHQTLLSVEELALIAILKHKAKDGYSEEDLYVKTSTLFEKLEDERNNNVYQQSSVEKIDAFKKEILTIKNAILEKEILTCNYNKKDRTIYPLSLLNLEGYWYLVIFEPRDSKIKTFHLDTITNTFYTGKKYEFDFDKIKSFDNAINAFHVLDKELIEVQLYVQAPVAKYFLRKPLSSLQRTIKKYDDDSLEISITVTDLREIIPTIQRYMPHVKVIEPQNLKDVIEENIKKYQMT